MTWQIDLVGDDADIAELKKLAPACGCTIDAGADGRQCLSGAKFDALSGPEEVRALARTTLVRLNGLARLRYGNHRPVQLGAVSRVHADGRRDVSMGVLGIEVRSRASLETRVIRADGIAEPVITADKSVERDQRILADPKLIEVIEAIAGDIT